LHIAFVKPIAASALSIAVHFAVTCCHVLPVDVMAAISLIDRLNLPTTDTLKRACTSYHVTKPDVLRKHPVELFLVVILRHIHLSLLDIVRNYGT